MKALNLFFAFFFCFCSHAQNWATIGTKWHFSYGNSYSVFESVSDTLINGIICQKIQKSKSYDYCYRPMIEYTYYSGDSVFFYDYSFAEFQLLYDFDASAGDYWYYKFPGTDFINDIDSIKTIVDSTDFVVINSISLKRLFVHYEPNGMEQDWMFDDFTSMSNSTIIEFIGDEKHFINTYTLDGWQSEYPMFPLLRCFDDLTPIGHYETGVVDSCEWINSLEINENFNYNSNLIIFPNPVQNEINFLGFDLENSEIVVYSIDGKEVLHEQMLGGNKVDVSTLQSGAYLVKLVVDNTTYTAKFVKE